MFLLLVNRLVVPGLAAQNRESRSRDSKNRGPGIARNSEASRIKFKQDRGRSIQNRHPNRIQTMLKATLERISLEFSDLHQYFTRILLEFD